MSHTIDYSALEGDAKREAAMKDIKFWLGEDTFKRMQASVVAEYKDKPFSLETFRFSASFAGVQGYPVQAWFETVVAEAKMVAIKGVRADGIEVWYTGKADAEWISVFSDDAFMGYNLEGAKRKAEILNHSSTMTGITFAPDV
jgi:hypothetical protein